MFIKSVTIFTFFCFLTIKAHSQNIILTNPNNEKIEQEEFCKIVLNFDNDTTLIVELINSQFYIDSTLFNNIIDIKIILPIGQAYHNQFLKNQLLDNDTIIVNQSWVVARQTPRLFIDLEDKTDSLQTSQLWFGEWLNQNMNVVNGISFEVMNTDTLLSSDKLRVTKMVQEYCKRIGYSEFSDQIKFTDKPYTTGQEDEFIEGTIITPAFIESQNTPFMKSIANKYRLVIVIIVDWNY